MNSINELALYFGKPYVINSYITVLSPLVGDIVRLGEREYYNVVSAFTAIPTDMMVQLWDCGICWEDISDFDFFIMMTHTLPLEKTKMLMGDLDFTKFELGIDTTNNEKILYQYTENGELIKIDQNIYRLIASALRKMHGITPKPLKAGSKTVRRLLIEDERQKLELASKKEVESSLLPMISSMVNSSEFKYGPLEIESMTLYAFMDSVQRIPVIKNATALLHGCYSGMIDTKKISKNDLNWMRKIA